MPQLAWNFFKGGNSTRHQRCSEWDGYTSCCSHDGICCLGLLYVLESYLDNFLHLRYKSKEQSLQKSWCTVCSIRRGLFEQCYYTIYLPVDPGELAWKFQRNFRRHFLLYIRESASPYLSSAQINNHQGKTAKTQVQRFPLQGSASNW